PFGEAWIARDQRRSRQLGLLFRAQVHTQPVVAREGAVHRRLTRRRGVADVPPDLVEIVDQSRQLAQVMCRPTAERRDVEQPRRRNPPRFSCNQRNDNSCHALQRTELITSSCHGAPSTATSTRRSW